MKRILSLFSFIVILSMAHVALSADYAVTTNGDETGSCDATLKCTTLRAAITAANASAGLDKITFDAAIKDAISLTKNLPSITDPIFIDGAGKIEIRGFLQADTSSVIVLFASSSTIQGLAINSMSAGSGIYVVGTGNTIKSNQIGVGKDGTIKPNKTGIHIGGNNNSILNNQISGNGMGVFLSNTATLNIIKGNKIGTDVSGMVKVPNTMNGIFIRGEKNTVGGVNPTDKNIISGNGEAGILIQGISAKENTVIGNNIGTNLPGFQALPNKHGVKIENGATANHIGGTAANQKNLISGNKETGVYIFGNGTNGNFVQGNWIGYNSAGTAAISNLYEGVTIDSGINNTIGELATETVGKNLIYGNTTGVYLTGNASQSNLIKGNSISSNKSNGIRLDNYASNNEITNNSIDHSLNGIVLSDTGTINNTFTGNTITANNTNGVNIVAGSYENVFKENIIYKNLSGIVTDSKSRSIYYSGNLIFNNTKNAILNSIDNLAPQPPVLSAADSKIVGSEFLVGGKIEKAKPSQPYFIEFFAKLKCADNEGQITKPIGSISVETDGSGQAIFSTKFAQSDLSNYVSATVTGPYEKGIGGQWNQESATSGFSNCVYSAYPQGTVGFVPDDTEVFENISPLILIVQRDGGTEGTITLTLSQNNSLKHTALENLDYTLPQKEVTIVAGETQKTFNIEIINREGYQGTREFYLHMSGNNVGTNSDMHIIISDDETCGDVIVQKDKGEECDDGNLHNDDYCTNTCKSRDKDGDFYIDAKMGGNDCDDTKFSVHPNAVELCNQIDDNCDGNIDEGYDVNGSCTVEGQCAGTGVYICKTDGTGVVCSTSASNPGTETCDGQDNDCNGMIDDNLGTTTCGVGACLRTVDNCKDGVTQECVPGTPTDEICDGIDNNCDGTVDEGCPTIADDKTQPQEGTVPEPTQGAEKSGCGGCSLIR